MNQPATQPTALEHALPCPFCGWRELRLVDWASDDGEYQAVECKKCLGTAPATQWNNRARGSIHGSTRHQ